MFFAKESNSLKGCGDKGSQVFLGFEGHCGPDGVEA